MTPQDFAYWLQGFFELSNPTVLTSDQIEVIRKHLNLVFEDRTGCSTQRPTQRQQPDVTGGVIINDWDNPRRHEFWERTLCSLQTFNVSGSAGLRDPNHPSNVDLVKGIRSFMTC